MTEPAHDVTVRLIRHGTGPRHLRLRRIWEAIDAVTPNVTVEWCEDKGSHEAGLMENFARPCSTRFLLLTEEDFLPNLDADWTSVGRLLAGKKLVACEYRMRDIARNLRPPTGTCAGWYLAFDRQEYFPKKAPDFGGTDPGTRLQEQIPLDEIELLPGTDCRPAHFGVYYQSCGTHLFWSRHLHDDPNRRVSGISLGEVQKGHDLAVQQWLVQAPESFYEAYRTE